jgi:hypothetical protein
MFVVAVAAAVVVAGKPFGYPLDDTYIHMAMGRTLATSGVWGAGPAEPAAASSSPLWTLLLAVIYTLCPVRVFPCISLLLNLTASCGMILLLLSKLKPQPASIALVAATAFAAALPSLSIIGMEHALHALLAVALCFLGCEAIADPAENTSFARAVSLGSLAGLAVAARYESLFLVAPLVSLSVLRSRFRLAAAIALGAALPVLSFGLLWIHAGGWLLPNSLILKRNLTEFNGPTAVFRQAIENFVINFSKLDRFRHRFEAMLLGMAILIGCRAVQNKQIWDFPALFTLCALSATFGHFAFASVGWLYRYETWLIILDITAICLLAECLFGQKSLIALAVLIVIVFFPRTMIATEQTIQAIDDRRLEHLAPARFVDLNYSGQIVMVNDLGAVSWFAPKTHVVDIFGLGSNEPVRLRLTPDGYNSAALAHWAVQSKVRIAILQVCWDEVQSRLPAGWTLVATWRFPRNVVFKDHVVGFFAIAPGEEEELRRQLKEFPPPPGVELRLDTPREAMRDGCF